MVTFETKIWEKDWEYLLKGDYLDKMISNCGYDFDKRHIIINNVKNRSLVEKYCEQKVQAHVIDSYYCVEDYADEVLKYFGIQKDSFRGGYNYSISELLGIYKCETDFLLHFSSDSYITDSCNWVGEAMDIMKKDNRIAVANPVWNGRYDEAKAESVEELPGFYVGYGFSDQCYLIRKTEFMQKIYNQTNEASDRYPKYGGELFEKRVDAYMRNNEKLRITSKHGSYISKNFPRNWFFRKCLRSYIIRERLAKKLVSNLQQ